MTAHKTLAAGAVAALALSLAACGGDDDADNSPDNETSSATESAGADDGNLGFTELQFGDTFTFKGDDDNPADVDLRVDDISVSSGCHDGHASYSDTPEDPGSTFVKITGDMDVKSNSWNDSFYITVGEWVAVDADGYSLEIAPALTCNTEQINTWSNPLDAGQKRHAVEEFEVKGVPVQWGVKPIRSEEGWGWGLPEAADAPAASGAPDPTSAAPEAPANAPAPVAGVPVPDPDVPGANQPQPGESSVWYDEDGNVTGGMNVDENGNVTYY
jgi:hypothetical protein